MFTVYILKSSSGKSYTGYTSDIDKRLTEHNSGLCKTTKACSDWVVIYTEEFKTRSEAMSREKWLKSGIGREFIKNKPEIE